jgi:hypothetical protein
MKEAKKLGLVQVLTEIKKGLSPAQICKKYNIPKQTLQYSVSKLKKLGCAEKVSYGIWRYIKEVPKEPKGRGKRYETSKQIRGHAFIWKIRFIQNNINWRKRLVRYNIPYSNICNGKVERIIFKGRKIWLSKKGITIYEPLDFLGSSAIQTKGKAVWELDQLIKSLGKKLNLNLNFYKFTTSREHYGLIKNELAKQYNNKGEKLYVRGEDGSVWLWIDNSHSLHELENKEPILSKKIQDWYNDHKKHNFEVTPSFVLQAINQNTQNLNSYAIHLKSHVKSIKTLGKSVQDLTEIINQMKGGKFKK